MTKFKTVVDIQRFMIETKTNSNFSALLVLYGQARQIMVLPDSSYTGSWVTVRNSWSGFKDYGYIGYTMDRTEN